MKFKEKPTGPKEEAETASRKLNELSNDELADISGCFTIYPRCAKCGGFHPDDQPCPKPLI